MKKRKEKKSTAATTTTIQYREKNLFLMAHVRDMFIELREEEEVEVEETNQVYEPSKTEPNTANGNGIRIRK